jgi:putative transposase
MTEPLPPDPQKVLELFDQMTARDSWLSGLRPAGTAFSRIRIYSLGVVVRLMILQRLLARFTLSCAVQHWARTQANARAQSKRISTAAGGYCRARQKLPTLVAIQVFEKMSERLRGWLPRNPVLNGSPIYVLDGTTLQVPHAPELVKAYPPPRNQHGRSHWPLIRLVVLQDVQTGLALRPHWGPMTDSEQALAGQAIPHLPSAAVLLGDRNFGVFGVAWAAHQRGHAVLLRLTQDRAEHLADGRLACPLDRRIHWRPTRWDRCGGPYPDAAAIEGRLVCLPASYPAHPQPLYFFTTLDLPDEQIRKVYDLRWNVETDLRSIKRTVHLQELSARSPAMLEKELFLALAAYNLVRAVICLAAEKAQVPPRRISFTNVYTLVETFSEDLQADDPETIHATWQLVIRLAAEYKLPNRSKPRSFPRAVWPRPKTYPHRHSP